MKLSFEFQWQFFRILKNKTKYFRLLRCDAVWLFSDCSLLSVCWGLNSRTGLGLSLAEGPFVLRMPMPSQTALSDWAWACAERGSPAPNWVPDQFCYLNLNKRKAVDCLSHPQLWKFQCFLPLHCDVSSTLLWQSGASLFKFSASLSHTLHRYEIGMLHSPFHNKIMKKFDDVLVWISLFCL